VIRDAKFLDILHAGISELGLNLDPDKIVKLVKYIELLLKWNKIYSLTAITDLNEIVTYHILDGLSVVKYLTINQISFSNLLDVGSGMGVPGIILAISYPDRHFALLDSNNKKSTFLRQVSIELGLTNVEVLTQRVENYHLLAGYDILISRAFARIDLFIELTKHLLKPTGFFLAMKSKNLPNELAVLNQYQVQVTDVAIPGVLDKRFLVKISHE
jgi:16S rRNA (guanine527-N7)-methyltransferase